MKTAFEYGYEAFAHGINRVCDDRAFMAAMVERNEKDVDGTMRAWKRGYFEAKLESYRSK